MRININVQDICNFTCSYCINGATKNKKKSQLDKSILEKFIEDIDARKCSEYLFAVAGGEPLLYPHVESLVENIDTNIHAPKKTIAFATNASLLPQKGELLYRAAKNTRLKFSVSVHVEQIDIHSFAKMIRDFGHSDDIRCKILVAPGTLEESKKLLTIFSDYGINAIVSVVTHPGGTPFPYSHEEIEFLQQHETANPIEFFHEYNDGSVEHFSRITRGLHPEKLNYQGMFCAAGLHSLRLAPNGTVSRCFGFLRRGETFDLNVLRLRDIPELNAACICPSDFCTCLSFLQIPKWRSSKDMPEYMDTCSGDCG